MDWVKNFAESSPRVFVVHGESTASRALAAKIREDLGLEARIPRWKERLILKPKEVVTEEPGIEETPPDLRRVMAETIAGLEGELNRIRERLEKIPADGVEEEEVDELKYLQRELQDVLAG
jgi:metallo-beta-lactamase family protein